MTKVATLAKPAATPTKPRVPAAGDAAVESIRVKSPSKQIPSLEIRRVARPITASDIEEARSLKILWNITLGILIYAVAGAIITLVISN
jgi:hypothetical protein